MGREFERNRRNDDQGQPVDKRGRLAEGMFSYRVSKDDKVFISWHGRQVTMLRGKEAGKFLAKMQRADAFEAQMIMAKATGNFKHGNERS